MTIEKKPFRKYSLGKSDQSIISLRVSEEKRQLLDHLKKKLRQPKDSTVVWQSLEITKVLLEGKEGHILELVLANLRRNQRTGIIEYL